MNDLDALRRVDFGWVVRLQDIWTDQAYDVADLHAKERTDFLSALDALTSQTSRNSPFGEVMIGQECGKSHLLCWLRHEAMVVRKCAFVLADMTDVNDFWDTVCLSYVKSLETPVIDNRPQYRLLLERFVTEYSQGHAAAAFVAELA